MKNTADMLEKLSPEMRELLLLKLKKRQAQGDAIPKRQRQPGQANVFPLSFAQQRLWFLNRYMDASAAYNIAGRVDLRGQLDVHALELGVNALLRRHEILRTVYSPWEEEQIVNPFEPRVLDVEDISAAVDPESEAAAIAETEATTPIDLEQGPALRTRLLRLGGQRHWLLLSLHHIATDAWSTGLMVEELAACYAAYAHGGDPSLPELPIQYADFAAWHRQRLSGDRLDRKLEYWKDQLQDAPVLDLSFTRPRPSRQTFTGAVIRFTAPAELNQALDAFSRREGATLFTVLLATLKVLLYRYTGANDLVLGSPFANRDRAETQKLVGFFVNTLPLRSRPRGDLSFREFLDAISRVRQDAEEHQDLPFEKMVDALGVERDPSHTPLYQATFNLVNLSGGQARAGSVEMAYHETFSQTSRFDFSLALQARGDALHGEMAYNTDLFEAAFIERFIQHYLNLLASAIAQPETQLGRLSLLSPAERALLTSGRFGSLPPEDAVSTLDQTPSIHQVFERQAALRPDAPAVSCEGETWSYRTLDRRATRIARALRRRGVRLETRVGLCLERSPELIAAILGTLKAGGVYVPMDPNYPAERLGFIAGDAGLALTVVQPETADKIPSGSRAELAELMADTGDDASPATPVHGDNGAYLIYTSGSTGKPKGALIPHRNVLRLFARTERQFEFSERDVWTLFHSYAFDFTVWEIWGALFYGGRLAIVPYLTARSPQDFHRLLAREGVTVLCQSPSAFRQLAAHDAASDARLDALRYVVFGAEALDLASLKPWFAKYADRVRLVNMYGITETTVHVTYRPIAADEQSAVSPIGKAIADLDVFILDRDGQPAPIGTPGEIHVAGPGLARGYLGRPELSAERFPAHPFPRTPGDRVYRTGDRACYAEDGQMIYLGRVDEQVKIRGFRIEPGEIQAVLAKQTGVRECAVLAVTDEDGRPALVAYIVAEPDDKPRVSILRRALAAVLPDYMVPAKFAFLDAFPMTAHGKLDRRALPAYAEIGRDEPEGDVSLTTPTEEALAAVWRETLGVDAVGRDDHFFNLGGDSIRSIRALGLAKERGLSFTLQDVFRHPTVKGLAREIDRARAPIPETAATQPFSLISADTRARLPEDVVDAYPMAQLQLGMIYEMNARAGMMAYHDVASFMVAGDLRQPLLQQSLRMLCARHPIFRTSLHLGEYGEPLQLVHRESEVKLHWIDLRGLPDDQQRREMDAYIDRERLTGFDMARPALVRYTVHHVADQTFRFTQTLCHPMLDGWSTSSSIAELLERHFALLHEGDDTPLAPPKLTYRDFIHLEQQAMQAPEIEGFWRRNLAGAEPMALPRQGSGLPQELVPGEAYNEILWRLPAERVERLRAVAVAAGAPLKAVLLAAHFKALSVMTGRDDVIAGVQVNGRNEEDGGDQVYGLFLNAMPARLQLRPGSWLELIRQAFQMEWETLPYRRFPMSVIQRWHDQPLIETFFNYVSFHSTESFFRTDYLRPLEEYAYSEPTHFPFFHGFNLDPIKGDLLIVLQSLYREISPEQIEATRGWYDRIFEAMTASVAQPETAPPHHQFSLLSNEERQESLFAWNQTETVFTAPETPIGLFEAQAQAAPDLAALIDGDRTWRYADLEAAAVRLSTVLAAHGAGPGRPVMLALPPSADAVTALLATMKTGAAAIPIDPEASRRWAAFAAQDAGAAAVVAHADDADAFAGLGAPVIDPELAEAPQAQAADSPSEPMPGLHDAACVAYLDDPTGPPRGFVIDNDALRSQLLWLGRRLALPAGARALWRAGSGSPEFIRSCLAPLAAGWTLVADHGRGVASLAERIAADEIAVAQLNGQELRSLLARGVDARLSSLKWLLCEDASEIETWAPALDGREAPQLLRLLAPAETGVIAALEGVDQERPDPARIGLPIANTALYLLDEHGLPAAPGARGSLFIGGLATPRCIAGRPAATAERYIHDRFSGEPGARLYRTGWTARRAHDGALALIGREKPSTEAAAFWRETLDGAPSLYLPLDAPRRSERTLAATTETRAIPAAVLEQARGVLPEAAPADLAMAAFMATLHRYSSQRDLVVYERMIHADLADRPGLGALIPNQALTRARLAPGDGFAALLAEVRAVRAAAAPHATRLPALIDALGLDREPGQTPYSRAGFFFAETQSAMASDDSFRLATDTDHAGLDLALTAVIDESELRLELTGAADLFLPGTLRRMADGLALLFKAGASEPERPIADLPMLCDDDIAVLTQSRHPLQAQALDAPARFHDLPVHQLFEDQAARRPQAQAVAFEDVYTSYAELNQLANRLAHFLIARGVRPETRVGLCLDRSMNTVAAILGVLKAGAVYVPLDPTYPESRLDFIAHDAGMALIITQPEYQDKLPESLAFPLDWAALADQPGHNPEVGLDPANGAYIIYTSGSTGKPKGVLIPHRNVVRLFTAAQPWFDFNEDDVWTLFHSYAFDFSVWEIWGALLYGGRLVVVPYWISRSPQELHELLRRERVTVLNQSPSAFYQLSRLEDKLKRDQWHALALRYVVFGAEALDLKALLPWFDRHGDQQPTLVNMYGITETTVHVTFRVVTEQEAKASAASPIGVSLADLRTYVLDPGLRLAPLGVPGEIFVTGAGLSRGYLNRPDLTAERFLPNPFAQEPGARLYKSGDQARLLENGDLAFTGRLDHQVKIRGFRIELGEIQETLAGCPAVSQAVVLAQKDAEGKDALAAYVIAKEDAAPSLDDLRAHLEERLPAYMVPGYFAIMDAFPMTAHGKLDRRALPSLQEMASEAQTDYAPPRNATEELLAEIWAEALGFERVGRDDNFFDLGGDSIVSLRITALAEQRGLVFTIQQLHQHSLLRDLARQIDAGMEAEKQPDPIGPFALISPEVRAKLPDDAVDAYPMTKTQLGMMFHMEMEPEFLPYYNVDCCLFEGSIEKEPFLEAGRIAVRRHPTLRTSFHLTEYGEPLQVVHAHADLRIHWEDLRGVEPAEQQRIIRAFFEREVASPFDPAHPPLVRYGVHRLTDQRFQYTLVEHHALVDGWSFNSLMAEMFGLCFQLMRGEPVVDPPQPKVQYRDFVNQELMAIASEPSRQFWRDYLDDCSRLELPPWPADDSEDGRPKLKETARLFSNHHVKMLRKLARHAGASLKSVLLAAHAKAMSLICGQRDVLTGIVTTGRPETDGGDRIYGLFFNTVPFRLDTGPGSWRELIQRSFKSEWSLTPHRRVPLAVIQEPHGAEPLFETMVNYINFHVLRDVMAPGDLKFIRKDHSKDPTNFTFSVDFNMDPGSGELYMLLQSTVPEIPQARLEQMRKYYENVLFAMIADAETARPGESPHHAADYLSADERTRVLRELNQAASPYPEAYAHRMFEARAAAKPDAPALALHGQAMSYAELDALANRLAAALRARSAGLETRVGVCLDRSFEMIATLLAILKTGAAYVPIDPNYPQARVRHIVDAAGLLCLATRRGLLDFDPGAAQTLFVDEAAQDDAPAVPIAPCQPHSLAYVIYTSGSTGAPKGVGVAHASMANNILGAVQRFGVTDQDRVLQFASISFDASVEQIFSTLAHGAALVLQPSRHGLSTSDLLRLLDDERVSVADLPTALWRELTSDLAQAGGKLSLPQSLRLVIVGGEKAEDETFHAWRRVASPDVALFNSYGPTETTVTASTLATRGSEPPPDTFSIGNPQPNYAWYILDAALNPVPFGSPGELFIAGPGLARGYLGQPALTAAVFLPNPFTEQAEGAASDRMYRTGDRVRHLPDGTVGFLGRVDFQVKIRGFRIETGEIEQAMIAHPEIGEAVVLAVDDAQGGKRLAAYYRPLGPPLDADALTAFLGEKLPDYMVPSAFTPLETFPLNTSGKLDLRALPKPELRRENVYEPPATDMEQRLAEIWADIFQLDQVGAADHFFKMGGHSLLATKLVSRVREAMRIETPLKVLFEKPVLRDFAQALEQLGTDADAPAIPALPRDPDQSEWSAPLSFAQERLWFLDRLDPDSVVYNMPSAYRAEGPLDAALLIDCFTRLARRHEALRTRFAEIDGQPRQIIAARLAVPARFIDLSGLPAADRGQAAAELADREAERPFALDRGPLWRLFLIRLAPESHMLTLNMHHIISDGWSMEVLLGELTVLYRAALAGEDAPLDELTVQYADFADWQRTWLSGETLARQLDYWKDRLADAPPLLELPLDRPRPPVQTHRGAMRQFTLSAELSARFDALCRGQDVTPFMAGLAVFAVTLSRYARQRDICVGAPTANRNHGGTEPIIGFFVNTLVLRLDLGGDPAFAEALARVKTAALDAQGCQDLPFEKLVEELQPERDMSHAPLFQVMFDLADASEGETATPGLPGLTLTPAFLDYAAAKFDLGLDMARRPTGYGGAFNYNVDLFDEETIARLERHFKMLLAAFVERPDTRLSQAPALDEQEKRLTLETWNDTARDYPLADTVDQFEARVAAAPNAVALALDGHTWTYAELNRRANILAHAFRRRGAGPDARVAVCLDRSFELIATLLGVLKSGAGYVPIDPQYPKQRIDYILADAKPIALATRRGLIDFDRDPEGAIWIDEEDVSDRDTFVNPEMARPHHALAYMIYTSGSTGQPKGVVVSCRNLATHLYAMSEILKLTPNDRGLQFASIGFDTSVEEIFPTLTAGAALVTFPYPHGLPAEDFNRFIARNRVSAVNLPTAYWREWTNELFHADPPAALHPELRMAIVGGEKMEDEVFRKWRRAAGPSVDLHNGYGPTEVTICATWLAVDGAEADPTAVTIGGPLPSYTAYIVDDRLNPTPLGAPGELCVDGSGLTRGYWNRPDLTAEKFTPNPFSDQPGARLYHTGDLTRWRADGQIAFLGRVDFQVKIRGFRIELGEIERALLAHPQVDEAVVRALDDPVGGKRLAAYYRPTDSTLDTAALRSFLAEQAPDYMIPAAFTPLAAFPRTASGKLDLRALPAPTFSEQAYEPPTTATEGALAEIWREAFDQERIGAADHFFRLGGHSLMATRVVSRVRAAFHVDLPLKTVFEHPVLRDLARAIETLKPAATAESSIVRLPRRADGSLQAPLSFAQERLWFLDRLEPEAANYNIPFAARVRGALDIAALQRSLDGLVHRHEALRTRFAESGGEPVQIVDPVRPAPAALVDLSGLPEARGEATLAALASADADRPFSLTADALFRATLYRRASDDHVLLINMHHIVSDGWSTDLMLRELAADYRAALAHEPSRLDGPALQYADFTQWQRTRLQDEALERQLDFWAERLAGAPPLLELPWDRPRPATQTQRGGLYECALPAEAAGALKTLAHDQRATPFMAGAALFAALLSRYARQADLCLGTPVANRDRAELEPMFGFFVNTLTLRFDLSGEPSLRELLRRTKAMAEDAFAHQDTPFERVVDRVQPERRLDRTPLFQAAFAFDAADADTTPELPGLAFEPFALGSTTAKFDVMLELTAGADGFRGAWEYNADLFDRTSIARMAAGFQCLLQAALAEPDRPMTELSLMDEATRGKQLASWNGAVRDYPRDQSLVQLFETQVARDPEAIALIHRGQTMTYGELNARANAWSHELVARGARPGEFIALCARPCFARVIGLLAILKTSGAYAPLDPDLPPERAAFMIGNSGARWTLAHADLAVALELDAATVLDLDDETVPANRPGHNPALAADPEQTAYVAYTSGSTGEPKGVVVSHRNVTRLVFDTDYCHIEPGDRVAQVSNPAFDAFTFEIWTALVHGGSLVMVDKETFIDAAAFAREIEASRIDAAFITAGLFRQFAARQPDMFAGMKTLIAGGDQVSAEAARAVLDQGAPQRLINGYGPTESTTFAVWRRIDQATAAWRRLPIGRPIANTTAYVLDNALRLVPPGVFGELCLGGDGLAQGYLNRPALTAAVFIPDPFAAEPGQRLYKTGDLARFVMNADEEPPPIESVGRIDRQVKIRGFRIEPGEIENRLKRLDGVRDALIRVWGSDEEKRLAAYVIPADSVFDARATRAQLAGSLPDYMIPSSFTVLDAFPLNHNGKVDLAALPEPSHAETPQALAEAGPRTPTEALLSEVWAALLARDEVNVADDFFELGGHSLLATRLASRIRDLFKLELPLRTVFEKPILRDLATAIDAARQAELDLAEPPITALPRDPESGALLQPAPLSHAQERLWFLYRFEPQSGAYNMPFAFRFTGPLDRPALQRALDALVRRHESLRTRFQWIDGAPRQLIEPASQAQAPLTVVDLSSAPAALLQTAQDDLLARESLLPFSLEDGPVFRATLLECGPDDCVFVMNMHHIVSDGWSMQLIFDEISQLYGAMASDREDDLPPLPLQYADFAAWQRDWLQGETLDKQIAYWKNQLAGAPELLELPWDYPRPKEQTAAGADREFAIDPDLSQALLAFAREQGATPFMALTAAFAVFLSRYARQDDVCVGTPIANRNRSSVESLVGFFVNTLALRFELVDDPSFAELAATARQTALDAYAHQDLPFEKLVEALQPERDMSHSPIFQAMFSLDADFGAVPEPANRLAGLEVHPAETAYTVAKFDLSLDMAGGKDGFEASFNYNTDLFKPDSIARMASHFVMLLRGLVHSPTTAVSRIDMTPDEEKRLMLDVWNDTDRDYPQDLSALDRFESLAAARPDADALLLGEDKLSYSQLNAEANRLAHALIARGVGPDARVGIGLDRSFELIIAIFATLKAGGAYVPLDPTYPQDRLQLMAEDAEMACLVTRPGLLDFEVGAPRIEPESLDSQASAQFAQHNPRRVSHPSQLAYAFYTSGSTGRPKAVGVSHQAVINYNHLIHELFDYREDDRTLQFSSISFDISVEEIFPSLSRGAALALHSSRQGLTTTELLELIERHGVTIAHFPTAYWREWTLDLFRANGSLTIPPSLRLTIVGGEKADDETFFKFRQAVGPDVDLFNGYGPTEATVTATWIRTRGRQPAPETLTIGHPYGNYRAYVLEPGMQLAPLGARGELHLAGPGLARGYLGQPAHTAERFIPNPFADTHAHGRLYRTGDLVRCLPDGQLVFLGRADAQVKIRGFRIELGEIERALAAHPRVGQALVAPFTQQDRQMLAAYVVPLGDPPTPAELRDFLADTLPEYMIPAAFAPLDRMPRTPAGKIDRKALPRPELADGSAGSQTIAPRNALEALLAELWQSVLGLKVGVRDNFFELGGHSLLTVKLTGLIKRRLGVDLPLAEVFANPTVERLAAAVQSRESRPSSPLVTLREGQGEPWFFIHPVGGQVHWYFPLANALPTDGPVYGLQAPGLFQDEWTVADLPSLAASYLDAIRQVQPEGPYRLAGWSIGGAIAFEIARQLTQAGADLQRLALIDALQLGGLPSDADDLDALLDWSLDLAGYAIDDADLHAWRDTLQDTPSEERFSWLAAALAQRGLTPPGLDPAELARLHQVHRVLDRAARLSPPAVYQGDLLLIRADDTVARLAHDPAFNHAFGWRDHCRGRIAVLDLPGDHYALLTDNAAQALAAALTADTADLPWEPSADPASDTYHLRKSS